MTLEIPKTRAQGLYFLLIVLALPVAMVVSDEALFRAVDWYQPRTTLPIFGWLVVQTALISHLVGRTLPSWPWRLIVLGWAMLLVDMLLYRMSANTAAMLPWRRGAELPVVLAYAFASSQFAAIICWAILGATRWQWRLPAVAATTALTIYLGSGMHHLKVWGTWYWVAAVQVAAVGALSIALRSAGFRVANVSGGAPDEAGKSQFSLAQMLLWNAALAPLLLAIQLIDTSLPSWIRGGEWLPIVSSGLLCSLNSLVAFWAALGHGHAALRLAVLWTAGLTTTGGAAVLIELGIGLPAADANILNWLTWSTLSGPFLAGLLLVFRATGCRLVRPP